MVNRVTLFDGRRKYKGPNRWIINVNGKAESNARTKTEAISELRRIRLKYHK